MQSEIRKMSSSHVLGFSRFRELRVEVYVSHINIIWDFSNNSKTEDDINWFIVRNLQFRSQVQLCLLSQKQVQYPKFIENSPFFEKNKSVIG